MPTSKQSMIELHHPCFDNTQYSKYSQAIKRKTRNNLGYKGDNKMNLQDLATLVALLKEYSKELTHALSDAVEIDDDVAAQKTIEGKVSTIDFALEVAMEDLEYRIYT